MKYAAGLMSATKGIRNLSHFLASAFSIVIHAFLQQVRMNFSDERAAGNGGGVGYADVNPCLPPIERAGNDKYQRGQPKKEENCACVFENQF